ncbi:unnamed protein product, partial [Ectocarpus sp. 12 AP-2014]
ACALIGRAESRNNQGHAYLWSQAFVLGKQHRLKNNQAELTRKSARQMENTKEPEKGTRSWFVAKRDMTSLRHYDSGCKAVRSSTGCAAHVHDSMAWCESSS